MESSVNSAQRWHVETLAIPQVRYWSPEDPHLYQAEVRLADSDRWTCRFGMREFTIRDNQFHLNGKPIYLKATFFAVMASFTNLALSASSLGTKYLNELFLVTREARDRVSDTITTAADYSQLGWLLISAATIGVVVPLLTVVIVQRSRLRTQQ